MEQTLKELADLFDEAKARTEFEFVMTLINYRGIGSTDVTNLYEWFDAIEFYKRLYNTHTDKEKTRVAALLYSTFFENSDFYNIIGSLCKEKLGYKGSSYLYYKTRKMDRLLGTGEKIELILELLNDCDKQGIIDFFIKNHFKEIRNTFFHSAYSLDDEENYILHDSDAIVIDRVGHYVINVTEFFYPRVENIILFFDHFKELFLSAFKSYTEDKEVFALFPGPTTATIFGSAEGLKGMEIKNTASFYGVMAHTGIYRDEKLEMWIGKNLRFDFARKEDVEIEGGLERYNKKDNISRSDAEFQNLIERIVERRNDGEVYQATALLIKFGGVRENQMQQTENLYQKKSMIPGILHYYKQALEIGAKFLEVNKLRKKIKELQQEVAA